MELIRQGARLRALLEVGDRGSFSAAADALGQTQSAVSQHVAALEASLGTTLVERGTRPAQLTEAGAALCGHVRAVLARLDTADQELAEIAGRRHGRLRIGSFPTALATFVPGVLAAFQRRLPEVSLAVVDDHMDRLLQRLVEGELDLALGYDDPGVPHDLSGLEITPLLHDEYAVLLPAGHRLAVPDRVLVLGDLRDEAWIGGTPGSSWFRITRQACRAAGYEPRVVLTSDDYVAVSAFVAAGLGVAVVPGLAATAATTEVAVRALRGRPPTRRIWVARPTDRFPSPATRAMVELLSEVRRTR